MGVLVFPRTVPVQVRIIQNHFFGEHYDVWLGVGPNVTASIRCNSFDNTGTPVFTNP